MSAPPMHCFDDLYRRLGIDGPLHVECPFARDCWAEEERPRFDDGTYDLTEWTKLPRPWVGERFDQLRLLCVAINMNESGGHEECETLVKEARAKIRAGATRVKFDGAPDYHGTFLYHRMGAYAVEIASCAGAIERLGLDQRPDHNQIAEAYDFLAYTNHVKCSPRNIKRSKPTIKMWENCGKFVTRAELQILQPRFILIVGRSKNHGYFTDRVMDSGSYVQTGSTGRILLRRASLDGHEMILVTVPHPAARGGMANDPLAAIRSALSLQN